MSSGIACPGCEGRNPEPKSAKTWECADCGTTSNWMDWNTRMDDYIPSDEELRDRVDTVAVRYASRKRLHVAHQKVPGGPILPYCGKSGSGEFRTKKPRTHPSTAWCKDCAWKLWNKRHPSNSDREKMMGDAYE